MQTKPVAHAVRHPPHRQFRTSVFTFHGLHCAASNFWIFHIQRLRMADNLVEESPTRFNLAVFGAFVFFDSPFLAILTGPFTVPHQTTPYR